MNAEYKSNFNIEKNKHPSLLKKEAARFVSAHTRIHSKCLKRRVSLSKIIEALNQRKSSRTKRLRCFIVSIDILRNAQSFTERENNRFKEYSIKGYSAENIEVEIHLREETSSKKDKELFMVSCFYK